MQLKGTSATGASRKVIAWTLEDKIQVYAAVKNDKTSPKEAFQAIATAKGVTLPASYLEFTHSHIWRFQKEFKRAIEKKATKVIDALRAAGLLDE